MIPHLADPVSPTYYANQLGRRLGALGIDVHASEHERYLVLLQDAPGQIIDLGRPLRASRIFGNEAIRRNIPIVADFTEFATVHGLENCMFWGIGLTSAKAAPDDLVAAMKAFNSKINIEFSELRKKLSFELLLIAIHPKFDMVSGLFDLHAHFICRVPPEHREAVHRRLMAKFSKIDLNTRPIRNPSAVVTYMLWGIWRNKTMLSWPDHALEAAWSLTQHRFRLFRTGGAFAKWRAHRRSASEKMTSAIDQATIKKNREETVDKRQHVETGDRLLSKVIVRHEGRKVVALLFEIRPKAETSGFCNTDKPAVEYTSATIGTTQESPSVPSQIERSAKTKWLQALCNTISRSMQSGWIRETVIAAVGTYKGGEQRIVDGQPSTQSVQKRPPNVFRRFWSFVSRKFVNSPH